MFVGWMVMGFLVWVEVAMGRFPVDFVSEGAIHLPIYVDIQKRDVTFFFCFLYIVVDTIHVV